ncbi:UBC-like protein [Hypoxylon sp. NC1633]|nr:UBC-like protein [Hypoxylon sp. NC1633]
MATPKFNSKSPTIRRILKEAAELSTSPSPDYAAAPLESDLFEWHFTLRGPPNSSYAGGLYHGRIMLPPTYPLRPPSFRFSTPSGRFEPNREICLSISGHHEETWQPAWGVRTALVALRAFMETDARGQLGGLDATDAARRGLAVESQAWRCGACNRTNSEIIAESEARAQEADDDSRRKKDEEVPAELEMGFRDDMEKRFRAERKALKDSNKAAAVAEAGAGEDAESAELAEGFVQTVPGREGLPPPTTTSQAPPAARPGQGVPAPTGRAQGPGSAGQQGAATQTATRRVDPNAGVPAWVDYAIVSLAIVLIAMVMKILVGR